MALLKVWVWGAVEGVGVGRGGERYGSALGVGRPPYSSLAGWQTLHARRAACAGIVEAAVGCSCTCQALRPCDRCHAHLNKVHSCPCPFPP